MIGFIIGLFVGTFFGVLIMCLCNVVSSTDEEIEKMEIEKRKGITNDFCSV